MSEVIFIYTTFANEVLATRTANGLLNDKLIACANIFPAVKSVYAWEGKIQRTEESVMILKTQKSQYPAIEEKIRAQHDNKCPCIVVLPVESGYAAYMNWILSETNK